MCFCADCDAKVEAEEVKGRFLNELCDCDIYTRWICHKCVVQERHFTWEHYRNNTAHEWDDGDNRYWTARDENRQPKSKVMGDHQHDIMVCNRFPRPNKTLGDEVALELTFGHRQFFCPCGAYVPQEARPRCTWCKRRHLPRSEWRREYEEVGSKMPFFDDVRGALHLQSCLFNFVLVADSASRIRATHCTVKISMIVTGAAIILRSAMMALFGKYQSNGEGIMLCREEQRGTT